jgi:hypothetical protein
MATTTPSPRPDGGTIRKSVPLTDRDLADLAVIRESPEAREAVGITAGMSEASQLHALVAFGLRAAREAVEAAQYAEYAEWARTDPEEVAIEAAMRARRARHRSREEAEA